MNYVPSAMERESGEARFLFSGISQAYTLDQLSGCPREVVTVRSSRFNDSGLEMDISLFCEPTAAPQHVALSKPAAIKLFELLNIQDPYRLTGRSLSAYVSQGEYVGMGVAIPPLDHADFLRLQEQGLKYIGRVMARRLRPKEGEIQPN